MKAVAFKFMLVPLSSDISDVSLFRDCSASGSLIVKLFEKFSIGTNASEPKKGASCKVAMLGVVLPIVTETC